MRLPLEPLLQVTGLTATQLRNRVHTFSSNIRRAERDGLSVAVADRWITELDLHPLEVYGDAWLAALEVTR
jgi:hypothetical protein